MSITYSSSLRARSITETLAHARRIARQVGISRVTDTTRLDRIGVPVFASIRPNAVAGSLCVSAGKGMSLEEARIGAYMEGIELAYAEPQRNRLPIIPIKASQILDGATRPGAVFDFAPKLRLTEDTLIPCVEAKDFCSDQAFMIPAECVVFPLMRDQGGGIFGSDGNGLCSGNTEQEAMLHGLSEVLERDITSFIFGVRRNTRLVRRETLPAEIQALADRLASQGFDLYVRYAENGFGLPYFMAAINERDVENAAHRGDGCHPCRSIALTRAVCEAMQSRLTDIHGGRDDLSIHRSRERPGDDHPDACRRFVAALASGEPIDYLHIPDHSDVARDIPSALSFLVHLLQTQGFRHILRVVLSPPELPISVIRVVVPRLECHIGLANRVGQRLKAAYEQARQADPL